MIEQHVELFCIIFNKFKPEFTEEKRTHISPITPSATGDSYLTHFEINDGLVTWEYSKNKLYIDLLWKLFFVCKEKQHM